MALPPSVARPVEALARWWLREQLGGGSGVAEKVDHAAIPATLVAALETQLSRHPRPKLVRSSAMPPPSGSIDEAAAAALGVPTTEDFYSSPFAALRRSGPSYRDALGQAYLLWPTLRVSRDKFNAALTAYLSGGGGGDVSAAAPNTSALADPVGQQLLAALREWRSAVAVLWAVCGASAAADACRELVEATVAKMAARRHNTSSSGAATADAGGRSSAAAISARSSSSAHASAGVDLRTLVKAQAAVRRWLARRRVALIRREGDAECRAGLRRLFGVACRHFNQRRQSYKTFIEVTCEVEAEQRRVDLFWEHEEVEFQRQWSEWEARLKAFYLNECPIDPTVWAYDSRHAAEGRSDVFVNLQTGRHHEEHPNTNKLVAARNREKLKATRAREARQQQARDRETAIAAQWTQHGQPAWEALLAAPTSLL
jgi:hypothetical protein